MAPTLLVEVSEWNADVARLDQLSRRLLADLRRQGVQVERSAGAAPVGAKSASAVAVAGLVVALARTPAAQAFVNGVFAWLGPRKGSVKISCGDNSIELSAATADEQRRLIEWLQTCNGETREQTPGDQEG